MAFNPIVDQEKCVGCEECVDVCPVEVFEMNDGKSDPVNAEELLICFPSRYLIAVINKTFHYSNILFYNHL